MPLKWQRLLTGAHEGRENIRSPNWTTTSSETQGLSVTVPEVSRTGERASGVLLLINQFHDSFECLLVIFCALPCEQRFFSCMAFSVFEVIRVACRRIVGLFTPRE